LAVFGKPRYLGLADIGDPVPKTGGWVVVRSLRGLEMGILGGALSQEQEAKYRASCLDESSDEHTRGPEPMLQEVEFVGPASGAQIEEHRARRVSEGDALLKGREILQNHRLQMKLVDVEYTMDRKKLFFYFTSEQRVDFRTYVRDLAKEFRIRIEMRQIGVRDEAKTVRGLGPCGRLCCCSYWMHRFTPINIRMVKEQNLVLNPTKISGICGRLMCCMSYEHAAYSGLWKSLPSPGSKIRTTEGIYVLDGVDLRAEAVQVRFPDGREIPVAIVDFEEFKATVSRGEPWTAKPQEGERPRPAWGASSLRGARTQGRPKTDRDPAKGAPPLDGARRPKSEKVSLEEHLAHMDQRPLPDRAPGSAPGAGADAKNSAQTRRRRRGGGAAPPQPNEARFQEDPSPTSRDRERAPEPRLARPENKPSGPRTQAPRPRPPHGERGEPSRVPRDAQNPQRNPDPPAPRDAGLQAAARGRNDRHAHRRPRRPGRAEGG
jgi:cell fate regulator YaaT (PSP1 superfamily)